MRVLVLGSGGREHALAWALSRTAEVFVAPGNAGVAGQAIGETNADAVRLAERLKVDLVVVGPESPLCAGVVDALHSAGVAAFGPSAAAAQLEGSKAFMKRFCSRHQIPTAPYLITSDIDEASRYIRAHEGDVVVKADGLAAGKGAIVTSSKEEALSAARAMLVDGAFGAAGQTIVVEDKLPGVEMSVHVVSDGERYLTLPVSRDHKRVQDGDRGPNTGGMGALAPIEVDATLMKRIEREVLEPTLDGMRADGAPYRGVLYAGLMIHEGVPRLLEHNVRFGDPETQVLMSLLDGDVAALLSSAARGRLDTGAVRIADRHALVVVLAAEGYPDSPKKGDVIHGLDAAAALQDVTVFHAGTRREGDSVVTAGGRVLGVTAIGSSAEQARRRAYRACDAIHWRGMHYRRDIGAK